MLNRKYFNSFDELLRYLRINKIEYSEWQKDRYKNEFDVKRIIEGYKKNGIR